MVIRGKDRYNGGIKKQNRGCGMAYIREKTEELTGYQERRPLKPSIDLMCDFVMVYGTDETM